jgi:hypothetical protein
MSNQGGWVKLHRKILASRYGRNMDVTGFFCILLAMTNHKAGFTADGAKILPGQFMTSQLKLADYFNCSRGKIKRLLNILEADGQIVAETSRYNTIITILNWEKYQGADDSYAPSGDLSGASNCDTSMTPDGAQSKNNKNNKNTIRLVKIASPLSPLFDGHSSATEIQAWLMAGELGPQQSLFDTYDQSYLVGVIEDAYFWQKEHKKRRAGRFIKKWVERDSGRKYKGGLTELQQKLKNFIKEEGLESYLMEA